MLIMTLPVLASQPPSIAFYYNQIDSVRELMNYDRVVVTPGLITEKQIDTLHKANTRVYAYLSAGEYDGATLPPSLQTHSPLINTNWQSHVMDLTAPAWQNYLLGEAASIMEKGFDGMFLDTLDSYTLFAITHSQRQKQEEGLVSILTALHNAPSQPTLIFNRGFDVLTKLPFKPAAVVAESLYHQYDPKDKRYQTVPSQDTTWLTQRLNEVKALDIEVIVIDYIPGSERTKQIAAAQRLLKEGYTPYVSDGMLYEFGVSTVVPVAKRVLGFYDGQMDSFTTSQCHRMLAMPIEYNGYVPDCVDIRTTDFSRLDITRYAGIALWVEEQTYQQVPTVQPWLHRILGQRPILFINALPNDQGLLNKLGIQSVGEMTGNITQKTGKNWTKNHYPATFSQFEPHQAWAPNQLAVSSLISFADEHGKEATMLFKAPWGGAIVSPFPVLSLANDTETWIVDPFRLLDETLQLPSIPAADATTESGLRILTAHIDGDGFPSKGWFPGKPYTAKVLLDHVFSHYPLPQTVSIIEGEIGKRGLYPEQSPAMERIARDIFKLPNVEIASHTFSHPFFWDHSKVIKKKQYGDHLPIPGYTVDYNNEIITTANYINNQLAPKGKKVELILWSGKADPTERILKIAEEANLLNVNGGNTYVVRGKNSFTQVSATIVWYPDAVQVYAPVLNENLYTNLWTEHHDGYGRAVETFEILGSPRRLKTISIYYHMYSGAYPASLNGLKNVYDWAMKQPTTPLYLSEYAKRARTLYETGIAKTLNGDWLITSSGVKSIRLPNELGYPTTTSQIAGWNKGPDGRYLILTSPRTRLTTSQQQEKGIRLQSVNGQLLKWEQQGNTISWSVYSHMPLTMTLAGVSQCQRQSGDRVTIRRTVEQRQLREPIAIITTNKTGVISGTLRCSAS
ncbi:RNA-binding protein [Photobacterium aphoticum]|uniref:RNA-binding protein n=2 Tax=Photobacterium aphoticum TaxID=754436 RepID=A0A0J1GQW6_9GAMM|nr:RNA-binding protein [Photobacterium aphoticum]